MNNKRPPFSYKFSPQSVAGTMVSSLYILFALLYSAAANAEVIRFYGEAFALNSKSEQTAENTEKEPDLLYREYHTLRYKEDTLLYRHVEYRDPSGELIASKENFYHSSGLTPDFTLQDHRREYYESAVISSGKIQMTLKEPGEKKKQKRMSAPDNLVVDAGFDNLIQQRWNDLINGQPVDFEFASPARQSLIGFRLTLDSIDGQQVNFKMTLSSRLLAWLVDPLFLRYDRTTRRLLSYQGLTNIADISDGADAENYNAIIRYHYD